MRRPGNQVHLPPQPLRGPRRARGGVRGSLKPFHVRDEPSSKGEKGEFIPLDEDERQQAIAEIQKVIPSFDYDVLLAQLKDREVLKFKFDATNVGHEKVQIFRIASEVDPDASGGDAAFKKFVNESYHIENEYVMQLNPREFDAVRSTSSRCARNFSFKCGHRASTSASAPARPSPQSC